VSTEHNRARSPRLQPRHGKAGAAEFFASLAELEFHNFVPKVILEGDGLVVALVALRPR
jgi:hypothetical protein